MRRTRRGGTAATFLWLTEEFGELATALRSGTHDELAAEMADVLAWLATLANIRGVDLEEAVLRKYGRCVSGLRTRTMRMRPGRKTLMGRGSGPAARVAPPPRQHQLSRSRPRIPPARVEVKNKASQPGSADSMKCDFESKTMPIGRWRRLRWPAALWVGLLCACGSALGSRRAAEDRSPEHPGGFRCVRLVDEVVQHRSRSARGHRSGCSFRRDGERFSGFMEVVVVRRRWNADLVSGCRSRWGPTRASGSRLMFVPARATRRFAIRLFDSDGRRVGGASQATAMPQPPEAMMPNENLILTLGRPQGVETMADLPGFKAAARGPDSGIEEIVTARVDISNGSIPGRWYGYDAARVIVLDTGDREVMSALDALRGRALVDWVERGGHLVVAVGANWQVVRDSVLAPILPGLPNGQEQRGVARVARLLRELDQADHAAGQRSR